MRSSEKAVLIEKYRVHYIAHVTVLKPVHQVNKCLSIKGAGEMIPAHVLIPSLYKLSYLHVMGRLVICGVVHAETVESYFLITFDLG